MTDSEAREIDVDTLRAVYGGGAEVYDDYWHPVIRPPALAVIDALPLRDATRVLDVGAGTGGLTAPLRAAAPSAHVVSIDASMEMLCVARTRARATASVADAAQLPIASTAADAVVLPFVLFHLSDPPAAIRETARVLRRGGSAGTVTFAWEQHPHAFAVWEDTLREFDIPILPPAQQYGGLDTIDHIAALLRNNGLEPARVWMEEIDHTFTTDQYVALRCGALSGRIRFLRADPERAAAAADAFAERVQNLPPDDFVFRGEVVCATARKP